MRFLGLVLAILGTPLGLAAQHDPVEALSWMSGCWVAEAGTSVWEEQWMAPRAGVMVGMARHIRGGEIAGYEFLLLRSHEGRLTYWAYPSGQDPTDFPGTLVESDRLRFENPDHDFPQKLVYHRTSADSLRVKVFGAVEDEAPAFEVPYARARCPSEGRPDSSSPAPARDG